MIDNLTEAIVHCREKAEELKDKAFSDFDSWTEEGKVLATNCLECANEHEQLASWLEELKERREADGWISVSKRLPDKEGKCLVFTDYGDVTMDSYRDGLFVCNLGNVTYWRPLPKAPEIEDK